MNQDIFLYILFMLPFAFAVLFQESIFQKPNYYYWLTFSIGTIAAAYLLRCTIHHHKTPLFCISSYSLLIFLLIEGLVQLFYSVYFNRRHEFTEKETSLTDGFFSIITKGFVVGFPFLLDVAIGRDLLDFWENTICPLLLNS